MSTPETVALGAVVPPIPSGPSPLATLITIAAIALPAVIVFIVLRYKANRAKMLQETILKLAEQGQPIPERLLEGNFGEPEDDDGWEKKSPLHKGVILAAIGAGIIIMLLSMGVGSWGAGLIPLLMGLGYLIIWKLEEKNPG